MTPLELAVAEASQLLTKLEVRFALVGGLAVGAWTTPRFTQDFDFAVDLSDDAEAESLIRRLHGEGYALIAMVEQESVGRLATARLLNRQSQLVMDLLFASSGIEGEAATMACPLKVAGELEVPVAQPGHLIAMKVLSRDDERRPQDRLDLKRLLEKVGEDQMQLARTSLRLITERGYHRGKKLVDEFEGMLSE